jgi:uncharacterized protein with HEPN domain
MPSEVPRARLQDIITNIDRVRAHLKGMQPDAELDDKTRDAVERCLERISEAAKKLGSTIARIIEQELGPLRQACVNELAARGDDDGAG